MMQPSPVAHTFEIEGQKVVCHQRHGHRLWHCACADFARRLTRYGEGFCAHTAAAMMRHLTLDGRLKTDFPPQ